MCAVVMLWFLKASQYFQNQGASAKFMVLNMSQLLDVFSPAAELWNVAQHLIISYNNWMTHSGALFFVVELFLIKSFRCSFSSFNLLTHNFYTKFSNPKVGTSVNISIFMVEGISRYYNSGMQNEPNLYSVDIHIL